jgi:CheY-like chemotaxis protein
MYILIVEDDEPQFNLVKSGLERIKGFSDARIERIATELDFQNEFHKIIENKPDVIIMDVMLCWTHPARDMPPEPGDMDRAGIRCEKMLANNEETKNIPVILYTVLSREDLKDDLPNRQNVRYLDKDFNSSSIAKEVFSVIS